MEEQLTKKYGLPTAIAMVIGIVIISLGIAIFKQSHLGNDSITALNIRLSELLGISLGVQNICTNLVFLVVEFIWGRKYIGLGTLVNGLGCGFIITFFYDIIAGWFGPAEQLPIQLLWVNLVTDCFPALALGMENAEKDIMQRRPRSAKAGIFAGGMGGDIAYQGLMVSVLVLASYFIGHFMESGVWEIPANGLSPDGTTMAFLTMSMAEIFHSLNMRSQRGSLFTMGSRNWALLVSSFAALLLTTLVCEVPFIAAAFDFTSVEFNEYIIAIGMGFLVIPIVEIVKFFQRLAAKKKVGQN